jgi:hypothetical protein
MRGVWARVSQGFWPVQCVAGEIGDSLQARIILLCGPEPISHEYVLRDSDRGRPSLGEGPEESVNLLKREEDNHPSGTIREPSIKHSNEDIRFLIGDIVGD